MSLTLSRDHVPLPLCGRGRHGLQLSTEGVETARWLLQHMPEVHHLALCDLIPEAAVVKWADARRVLLVEDICERWDCSRASAYRWLRAMGRQNGVEARTQ